MPEATLNLEEQYKLPLVKEIVEENDRLRALLQKGTKLPDSQIEDLTVPHVFKNKLLMKEGEYNGVFYPKEEIVAVLEDAEGKGLIYDHLDSTDNEGASNWNGQVENPRWDESGEEGAGMYGDLKVVDKACAQLLAGGAKWGISATIDYQKNEVDGRVIGTDLLWKSFSFVLSPAVRETMLNNLKKIKGDLKMGEPNANDLAHKGKKYPYKYPAQNQEDGVKINKKEEIKAGGELQVDEETFDVLQTKDAEILELKKFKDKMELEEKSVVVAELVANEYLIGRLATDELAEREKALMEKSSEVLTELAEVIGSHAELSAFTDFVKAFVKKNKGSTIKDAAKAWNKQQEKGKAKGKGKLGETPTVENPPPNIPGGTPPEDGVKIPPGGIENNEADEGEEGEAGEGAEGGEEGTDNLYAPGTTPQKTAALTGADNTPGKEHAELNSSGLKIQDSDKAMHDYMLKVGGAR